MKYTILQMEQSSIEFKKTHTVNIGGMPKEGKAPKYFIDFVKEQREMWKQQLEFNKIVLSRIDNVEKSINARIDNLIKVNKLKE